MGIYEEALGLQSYLTSLRRELHRYPEVSRKEFWTAGRIEQELDAIGITEHQRVDGTGVCAVLRGEKPGERVMALRADTDALPIEEKHPDLNYCSGEPGVMHACGHDGHTASLLGAAKLLYAHRADFGGEVRFFFQHAEEVGWGGKQFVKAGLCKGVGRIFGVHMAPDLPLGKVGVTPGPNNASVDHFTVKIQGKAAHVSTPHLGVDALYIASQTVVALQPLVSRRTSPIDPVILGVGKMSAGTSYNIVAGSALLEGTTRTFSAKTRAWINGEIDRVCMETAKLYGGEATVEWEDFTGPLVNPPALCPEAAGVVAKVLGEKAVVHDRPLSLVGDDFAELQAAVPGVYGFVGTASPDWPDTALPLHNDRFDLSEEALAITAALHTEYTLEYLSGAIG